MTDSMQNRFLIAMPSLEDPNFQRTVTLICEHNDEGTLGLIINRPSSLTLGEMLQHLGHTDISPEKFNIPVYTGGPVQPERGFVIHNGESEWESSLIVADNLHVTTSKDILDAIAVDKGPSQSLFVLGYAGWGAKQLDEEMIENAWLSTPASSHILFDTESDDRWMHSASAIGVDLTRMSMHAGHA